MTTITTYVEPELKAELQKLAEKKGRPWSVSSLLALAAKELVDREKKKKS